MCRRKHNDGIIIVQVSISISKTLVPLPREFGRPHHRIGFSLYHSPPFVLDVHSLVHITYIKEVLTRYSERKMNFRKREVQGSD